MHLGEMVVYWVLQRTSTTIVENGGHNELDNSANQVLTESIWANENSRVDYAVNRPLKGFFILGTTKSTAFQNYQNHLSSSLGTHSTLETLG